MTLIFIVTIAPAFDALEAMPTVEVVASGLDNPRGLAFAPNGILYVAEAGRGGSGPCYFNSEPRYVCVGATGAITRVMVIGPSAQSRVVTGLPSAAPPPGAAGEGTAATGPHKIAFQGNGNGVVTIGLGSNATVRDGLGPDGAMLGTLVRFLPDGSRWSVADLAEFETMFNPDGLIPDSNPYGVDALPARAVYVDAGGNALNEVAANGKVRTLAVFPNRLVPFGPPGNQIPMQAVPTAVRRGPDGDLYVGQLTGFPFPVGEAKVYRVPSDGGIPTILADGFTNIVDLAFGPDGSLYVLEMAVNGLLSGDPTGALTRIAAGGERTTIASLGLVLPGGVAIGPDGFPYVTRFATVPGAGDVVRIRP